MKTNEVIVICSDVLAKLKSMDSENSPPKNFNSSLIFPMKNPPNRRVSEQELRILFIDEFKKRHIDLFYSIETPTKEKYRFKDDNKNSKKQSASIDLTIFKNESNSYDRELNIEFKFKANSKSIEKDIEKLVTEPLSGVFIQLLENSDSGTFLNKNKSNGLFKKIHSSFKEPNKDWKDQDQFVLIVIISITDSAILHKEINKNNINDLDTIFMTDDNSYRMEEIKNWNYKKI